MTASKLLPLKASSTPIIITRMDFIAPGREYQRILSRPKGSNRPSRTFNHCFVEVGHGHAEADKLPVFFFGHKNQVEAGNLFEVFHQQLKLLHTQEGRPLFVAGLNNIRHVHKLLNVAPSSAALISNSNLRNSVSAPAKGRCIEEQT